MKILIIDNDISTVTTLKALLMSQEPFQIEVANSGQEGLDKMASIPGINVVLLDIMMPIMSGMEVCKIMVNNRQLRQIPVLLMSSALPIPPEEYQQSLEKFSELSVVKGVLEKPFAINSLIEQIHKVAK